MKRLFLILLVLFFSTKNYSQESMIYGFKGGIGISSFMNLENSPSTTYEKYPTYSFPLGFSLGFYIEKKISKQLLLVGEFLYQKSIKKITISTGIEGILDQKVTMHSFKFPILLKYQPQFMWNFYFTLGPSFTIPVEANYNYFDHVYSYYHGSIEVTKNFPSISTSIELGIGKTLVLSDNVFFVELSGELGLTKFHYEGVIDNYKIGKWNSSGLIFFIGLQF